jgi:hypothetical protein
MGISSHPPREFSLTSAGTKSPGQVRKPTERANEWRDDAQYPTVCKTILKEVYPAELISAVSEVAQRGRAESWFAQKTSSGESAASRMAALYCVLLEADASKQPDEKAEKARSEKKTAKPVVPAARAHSVPAQTRVEHQEHPLPNPPRIPGININLEIHISADSSLEQIDAIFAAMAKHLYPRG